MLCEALFMKRDAPGHGPAAASVAAHREGVSAHREGVSVSVPELSCVPGKGQEK